MSLLNDALRKKRSEQQPDDTPLKASLSNAVSGLKRKRQWATVICGFVVVAAACGVGLFWSASQGASKLSPAIPPAGFAITPTDHTIDKQAAGISTVPFPIAALVPAPSPADTIPEVAEPPARIDRPGVQTGALHPPVTPSTPVESRVPPQKQPARHAEKGSRLQPARQHPSAPTEPVRPRAAPVASGTGQNRVQIERLYQKARQYHRRNRLEQAIALYQEVIRIDPDHPNARFNLAAAYLQTEAYTEAYSILADLYRKEPANQQIMLNLAISHIGCGRYQQALDLLDKAEALPDAPLFEIAFHKAVAYNHLNQTRTALTWYKRAEALRPDDSLLLFNLAVINDQQQQYAAAVDYYLKYIKHTPEIDTVKEKQIRRRARILQAYHIEGNVKEPVKP